MVGVARLYAPLVATLVIDEADAELAGAVEAEGVRCVVAPTIMRGAGRGAGRSPRWCWRDGMTPARGVRRSRASPRCGAATTWPA